MEAFIIMLPISLCPHVHFTIIDILRVDKGDLHLSNVLNIVFVIGLKLTWMQSSKIMHSCKAAKQCIFVRTLCHINCQLRVVDVKCGVVYKQTYNIQKVSLIDFNLGAEGDSNSFEVSLLAIF